MGVVAALHGVAGRVSAPLFPKHVLWPQKFLRQKLLSCLYINFIFPPPVNAGSDSDILLKQWF